ncbi:poly(A)-binding protein binding protein [Coemansia guatemalensis]|uniref:Poly(A)-binding protein binding protein n=1 Tax=Coemansia guatemalensis TaxID=2761395 RepID=A0A9W8HWP6_9FUNG|nr:poly(A)-binding protein binding protein [Coemansia guatemalensis]
MATFNDSVRGSKLSSGSTGTQKGKTGSWSSGPPQFGRTHHGSSASNRQSRAPQSHSAAGTGPSGKRNFGSVMGGNNGGTSPSGIRAATSVPRAQPQDAVSQAFYNGLIEGEDSDQVDAMHKRLLCLLSYLVGTPVRVTTTSGEIYLGILCSINPNDAQSVVLRYAYAQHSGKTTRPTDTLLIHGDDCLDIRGVVAFADDSVTGSTRAAFRTDADISGGGAQAAARELHRWVPDESEGLDALENGLETASGTSKGWDQFATNERLFGLTTDFDEEIYTTKLDRNRSDFKEREREAIRIAQEIQSAPFLNSHVAEERHELAADGGDAMDEEDRYGAVLRPSAAPGKYVPPYLRSKADSGSKGKQQASPGGKPGSEPPARLSVSPEADTSRVGTPEQSVQHNNAMAAAALAKLNIRTTGHSSTQSTEDAEKSVSIDGGSLRPGMDPGAASPSLAADPAITALSRTPNTLANNKLANLRGHKHRAEIAAISKPMADITEKLNSERERIQQHKQALLKSRMSELVKFHKSFKLNTPMPEDVAEIVGAKSKGAAGRSASTDTASSSGPSSSASASKERDARSPPALGQHTKNATPEHPAKAEIVPPSPKDASQTARPPVDEGDGGKQRVQQRPGMPDKVDAVTTGGPTKLPEEANKAPKKASFKLNAKASSFKPSASASPFVPRAGTSSSRASSSAGGAEYNVFFGRRALNKSPLALWDGALRLPEDAVDGSAAPTWPFGSRTYRCQFVSEEPEAMYPPQGYMPPYGYGYYQPYQYPPQMPMVPPGQATRISASSPYTVTAAAPYGGASGGGAYGSGPYVSTAGYPSPVVVPTGRSPATSAANVPTPPTANPPPHIQISNGLGAGSANAQVTTTPDLGPAMAPGQAMPQPQPMHMHMGMVPPPPMPFNGMHAGGYVGPSLSQGYPPPPPPQPQSMGIPMGYAHFPPAQPYGTSPPNMAMMHGGSPHPEQSKPGTANHHPSGYSH